MSTWDRASYRRDLYFLLFMGTLAITPITAVAWLLTKSQPIAICITALPAIILFTHTAFEILASLYRTHP